jgi:hypothetical protein
MYGVLLYFGTEFRNERITGDSASLPDFLFYWVYYVGFNAVWAFIPACKSLSLGFHCVHTLQDFDHLTEIGQGSFVTVGRRSPTPSHSVMQRSSEEKVNEAVVSAKGDGDVLSWHRNDLLEG